MTSMVVIRLQDGLEPLMRNLVVHALMQVHGVETVTDLTAITPETLRVLMREPAPEPVRKPRRRSERKKVAA